MVSNPYPLRKIERSELTEHQNGSRTVDLYLECGHGAVRMVPKTQSNEAAIEAVPGRIRCKFCPARENAGTQVGKWRKRGKKLTGWRATFQRWMDRIASWRRG